MTTKGNSLYNSLIINTLAKISLINKRRKNFLLETFMLFLSIKGRINFLQLERYGKYTEQCYRQQFEKAFDFLNFNKELVTTYGSGEYILALDPSFISKSGKLTPGLGYFWSGQAGQTKRGLEIAGLAAIDIYHHTAFHLEAVQTVLKEDDQRSLSAIYADVLTQRKNHLLGLSSIVVADAWFSKKTFVDSVLNDGFHFVGRLRDDARLKHLHTSTPTGKRGRPKKHGEKVNPASLDKSIFTLVETADDTILHTAIVYSLSLERNIRVVHLETVNRGKVAHKLYFCTDTELKAERIMHYYRSRFQIEFLYRDAKQHTGLNHCQARSQNKLHFQFNMALSAINIAKIKHWVNIPKEKRKAFSLADVKTMNHNALLLERFFSKFGINPNLTKNQKHVKELIHYGTIAA